MTRWEGICFAKLIPTQWVTLIGSFNLEDELGVHLRICDRCFYAGHNRHGIKNPHLYRDDTMSPAARRRVSQYPVFLIAPFMPQPVPFVGSGWLAVGAT